MPLARRVQEISPSPTLAMNSRAQAMRREGIDIISFSVGEPDFPTPGHIIQAAREAMEQGYTRYTPAAGLPELRQAICEKCRSDQGLVYEPEQVVVSNGGKHAIFNALQVLVDPGEEVIIPAPYWVSYPEMVKMAGGLPVVVTTREEDGFKLTPDDLRAALTPRTRMLVVNSPGNPTGTVYQRQELEDLAAVLEEYPRVYVLSDDVYDSLVYDGAVSTSFAALGPEIQEKTVLVNAVSKTYAMTGWRIGYAAAPLDVARAMASYQSHATSNPNSVAQVASLKALQGDQSCVDQMVAAFARRRRLMLQRLEQIPGVTCPRPQGAFYVFPNLEFYLGRRYQGQRLSGSLDLAEHLLTDANLALVPGIAFGQDQCVRLSYATSEERINEGMDRLASFLGSIS